MTYKIMSYSCKLSEAADAEAPLMEIMHKNRQPFPWDAIYFIQPTKEKAFVFFSSPAPRELVNQIKEDSTVLSRTGALTEMNLEYFAIDGQGFVTDNERRLNDLFGDEKSSCKGEECLNSMAIRIATVFASLQEFPLVRYRVAKSLGPTTMTTFRDLIPTKLVAKVWNCLMKYKASLPNYPQTETCDLLILDRSIDQIDCSHYTRMDI